MFCFDDLQREMIALHTSQNKMSHLKNSIGAVGRDGEDEEERGKNDDRDKREGGNDEIGGTETIKPDQVHVHVEAV